jgi:hypothetical protein
MGRSRYPRRGHRLAPATLAEFLDVPVPAKYVLNQADAGLRLCDLDESAWDRFDEATCQELAMEVVRAVGRAARMPMPIGDRPLPAIPHGLTLTDLDLEVRTLNCLVSAGIHERPQDLRAMTIETILGLRGFWVKCLVDLLTSVEYVTDHPDARRALRGKGTPPSKGLRVAGRYPRPGYRLAPQALKEILTDFAPVEFVKGTPFEGLRLCDLNERVWDHLDRETNDELAELIVSRVNVSGYNRAVQQRRLPKPPKGVRLEDLRLENRTHNCLRREGFGKRPEELARYTIGQLLSIKAFGAKCLVDLLSSLETLVAREGRLDEKLTAEARLLGGIPEAAEIHFSDPRLGKLLRATDSTANTVGELVDHILSRHLDPPDPFRLYEQVCEVRRGVSQLIHLPLEEELIQIFSPVFTGRDKQIVAEYYGWDGQGGHTLEDLGHKYGLSRERIRQVCVRAIKRNRGAKVFAPVLDRALAFIAQRIPCTADGLKTEFDAAGFSACRLSLEEIRQAARFLNRQPQFDIVPVGDAALVVAPDSVSLPRTIIQAAKREVLSYGATTIREVAREVLSQADRKVDPPLILETLRTLPDFQWLDEPRGWFQLDSLPQYGLPNMIDKILSVTERIDVGRLRAAVTRYRRTGRNVPPAGVLLEFCRRLPGTRVEGTTVIADPPRDWRKVLAGVEAGMVQVLKEHGPVLERGEFEERCIAGGMNRFSFNAIVMCSPVVQQYGRSVYGLLGSRVDRKTIAALAAKKPGSGSAKVLRHFGRTEDGKVYLAYRLSKAAISGGVITVPAAMKKQVGGKYTIRTPENQEAGTLVSKNGCAWGLGPVLRGHNAQPGDQLIIVFDSAAHQAVVHIGGECGVLEPGDESLPAQGPAATV